VVASVGLCEGSCGQEGEDGESVLHLWDLLGAGPGLVVLWEGKGGQRNSRRVVLQRFGALHRELLGGKGKAVHPGFPPPHRLYGLLAFALPVVLGLGPRQQM